MIAQRSALLVLLIAAFLLPMVGLGVVRAIRSNANDVRDWLPGHYEETRDYQWFRQHFGNEDFVVVSWPGCRLDDETLARFAGRLRQRSLLQEQRGAVPPFRQVTTGSELLAQITAEPINLERDKAIIEKMPRNEASLEWFQLSRFDGPLVATRKLMERHYAPACDDRVAWDPAPATVVASAGRDARA